MLDLISDFFNMKRTIGLNINSENMLRESEARLHLILDQVPAVLWTTDTELRITSSLGAGLKVRGETPNQTVGKTLFDILQSEDHLLMPVQAHYQALEGKSSTYEFILNNRTYATHVEPLRDSKKKIIGVIGTALDITSQKQIERELRESESKYRAILDAMPDLMFRLSREGVFLDYNTHNVSDLYIEPKEFLGKKISEVFPPELSNQLLDKIQKAFNSRTVQVYEYQLPVPKGIQTYEARFVVSSFDEILVIVRNITERKEAEEVIKQKSEELERSNKDLEQFAAITSHDLQGPLEIITGCANRIEQQCGKALDNKGLDYLERVRRTSTRMHQLIDALLEYSKITMTTKPFEQVNLQTILKDVISDLETSISKSGASIESPPLPTVTAYKFQMYQLFKNLVSNALKFVKKDEKPIIKIKSRSIEKNLTEITVEDNGIGFEEEYKESIFDPFCRLHGKSAYEGSGIGLATCKKIIQRHNGTISAKSTLGGGSTFTITLPISLS